MRTAVVVVFWTILMVAAMLWDEHNWGTEGHVCFANHTCRDGMKCITGEGMEDGVCVK